MPCVPALCCCAVVPAARQAQPAATSCSAVDSCKGDKVKDIVNNFMDYRSDNCATSFTLKQITRMQNQWTTFRAGSDLAPQANHTANLAVKVPDCSRQSRCSTLAAGSVCSSMFVAVGGCGFGCDWWHVAGSWTGRGSWLGVAAHSAIFGCCITMHQLLSLDGEEPRDSQPPRGGPGNVSDVIGNSQCVPHCTVTPQLV
jgi:hypothetical protein